MKNSTVAIILAGGKSERMGVAKGMLKFGKTFWILEQINRLGKSGIKKVHIGLGYNYEHYFWGIDWFEKATKESVNFMGVSVQVQINQNPELGSFATLQTVLNKIDTSSDVLINPVDIPCLNNKELEKIIATTNSVVIPKFNNKNGHPIKLKSNFWNSLLPLDSKQNTSRLDMQIKKLSSDKIFYIEVFDKSILKNLNSPKDWKLFLKEY